MSVQLELLKGPLDDERIRAIGETSGQHDERYRSPHFCRRMFNENPYGYSFHAFARDGDRAVGHNSAIPMRLRQGADRILSAKGEALFLDEAYRKFKVKLGERRVPVGIALIQGAYEHAFDDGVELLHDITTPAIGAVLERMLGFSAISIDRDQYSSLTLPRAAPPAEPNRARALVARTIGLGQRGLRGSLGLGLALSGAPKVRVNAPEFLDAQLEAVAEADRAVRPGWGVSRDFETLRWELLLGRLEIYSPAETPDRFAVVGCSGGKRELLGWHLDPGRWREGLAVFYAIAARCERDGARMRLDAATAEGSGGVLRAATRLTGLVRRRWQEKMYLKANDGHGWSGEALAFDLLFNL